MPKRINITLDDDAADLLPLLASQAGKPHRTGQYLSELIRAAAVSQQAERRATQAELAELRQMVQGFAIRLAQVEAQVQPPAPRPRRKASPAYYTAPTPTIHLLSDPSPEYDPRG